MIIAKCSHLPAINFKAVSILVFCCNLHKRSPRSQRLLTAIAMTWWLARAIARMPWLVKVIAMICRSQKRWRWYRDSQKQLQWYRELQKWLQWFRKLHKQLQRLCRSHKLLQWCRESCKESQRLQKLQGNCDGTLQNDMTQRSNVTMLLEHSLFDCDGVTRMFSVWLQSQSLKLLWKLIATMLAKWASLKMMMMLTNSKWLHQWLQYSSQVLTKNLAINL